MARSLRFDDVLDRAYEPGMTADALLQKLSVEGGLHGARATAFRKLRTEDRLKYIRGYLRAKLVARVRPSSSSV